MLSHGATDVVVEHARYHCTRLGGLPFSGRLLSRLPSRVRKAHSVAASARDEGEVGEKAPTACQELSKPTKTKDEFGEANSDPYCCRREALCRAEYGRQLRRRHPLSTSQTSARQYMGKAGRRP